MGRNSKRHLVSATIIFVVILKSSGAVIAADDVSSKSGLSEALLDAVYPHYEFQSLTQREAEALMGSAIAAVYDGATGGMRMLADDDLSTARQWLAWRASEGDHEAGDSVLSLDLNFHNRLKSTAQMSLRNFLDRDVSKSTSRGTDNEGQYLIKVPTIKPGDGLPPESEVRESKSYTASTKDYYYIYDDFEGDVWSTWSRSDNTGGQFTWGVRSCDSYWGSYSADAPRGGSQGAFLGCTAPYPGSLETYMSFEACETVPVSWKAFLELRAALSIDKDGNDEFSVLFKDTSGNLHGWLFWGTSSGWWEFVFNLRQWYAIGDLGANYCNRLYLGFASDSVNGSGFGARVDDLYVYWGDTVGSYECSIIADPPSGSSPLTVSFRAATDMYNPDFWWRFGDGETSEERDPVHVFGTAGSYRVTLGAYDSYGPACYASTTINVTQGTCSYTLSPSSASFNAAGGSGNFSVSASSGCGWTASSTKSWITINSGASGSGNGTVSYSVSENTSTSQRTGTIQAAGKTFNITQAGAVSCSYSISPTSRSFTADTGTGSVSVTSPAGCAWTATSNKPWLSITAGSSGQGSGTVNYRVAENTSTSARTGTLTIAGKTFTVSQDGAAAPPPGDGEFTYFAVGVIHSGGAAGSNWRSTLVLRNRGDQEADVTLVYLGSKGERVTRAATIPARGMGDWDDTVPTLFGVGGNSSGIVQIESDQALQASVRTYNITANGTFGQMLPGVSASDSVVFGTSGILSPVQRTDAFRTNIGAINTGATACTVRVTFVSAAGQAIGSEVWFDLAPGEWKQNNDTLASAGLGTVDCAYALVDVFPDTGSAWAYATVIDNVSNDPTAVSVTTGE